MAKLEDVIFFACPAFALICLLGFLLWKLRPTTSPLWAPVMVPLVLLALREAEGDRAGHREFAAGIAIAGVAGFVYLEWRSLHRAVPSKWPTRRVILIVGVAAALAGISAATLYVIDERKQRKLTALQSSYLKCASSQLSEAFSDEQLDSVMRECWPRFSETLGDLTYWRSRVDAWRDSNSPPTRRSAQQ